MGTSGKVVHFTYLLAFNDEGQCLLQNLSILVVQNHHVLVFQIFEQICHPLSAQGPVITT